MLTLQYLRRLVAVPNTSLVPWYIKTYVNTALRSRVVFPDNSFKALINLNHSRTALTFSGNTSCTYCGIICAAGEGIHFTTQSLPPTQREQERSSANISTFLAQGSWGGFVNCIAIPAPVSDPPMLATETQRRPSRPTCPFPGNSHCGYSPASAGDLTAVLSHHFLPERAGGLLWVCLRHTGEAFQVQTTVTSTS